MLIEIKDLNKSFSNTSVLNHIDLNIERGDIFGIIGQSGAGKSTLLRCINGLEVFDSGSIKIDGKAVENLSKKDMRTLRKDLAMIFQSFNLLNRKTVFENVSLPLEIWGYDKIYIKQKVDTLLGLVGLTEKALSKPSELSGGQKQRVAIARALTLEPKVLLCDEATSALDPKTTKDILHLLNDLNKNLGITIVMVTHQMEVVKEICKNVALIDSGNLLYKGSVEELFLRPQSKLNTLLGNDESLSLPGFNIKIFFPSTLSGGSIITSMARELNINFSIISGKLEKFRDNILGNLVINIEEKDKDSIVAYLDNKNIEWEVI